MVPFFGRSWRRKNKRKSAFGGKVKSKAEVDALSAKIKAHEDAEMEEFEKDFDKKLEEL